MSREGRAVTLRDIAERVGITPAAVSMALTGSKRISARTRIAVEAAAADLGYVGSSAARALRKQEAAAIALIVPTSSTHVFGHSYFMHVLSGVSAVANARDSKLLISTNSDESHGLAAYERVMRSQSADGAIVTSATIDDPTVERLVASRLPIVLIGNFPHIESAVTIWVDDVAASEFVTNHLIEAHGRKRILHVAGPLDHQTGIDRRDGFLNAIRSHGLESESYVVEGDFSEASGFVEINNLGNHARDFDGIVFANDDMAYGGLRALRARGAEVPSDVSIVGFDDFGLSRVTTPSISTVRVPAELIGRLATERLFQTISGAEVEWMHQDIGATFVPRQSCGCVPPPARLPGAFTDDAGESNEVGVQITTTSVRELVP